KKIAGTTSTNAASGWSSSQGILLDVQPSVQIDSYSGTINWTLQDTP
ncbi:cell surface protein, partial [Lactobacillus reuteri]|nr:cell surface protein [Limosilactobacillus reuteri]